MLKTLWYLCFAQSNDAISVLTISKKSVYTMKDDEYWSEDKTTGMRKANKEYEKQHCQDVTHALVLDMCWHITSTVQKHLAG